MNLPQEISVLTKKLTTPARIQDYINTLAMRNPSGEILVHSPLQVIREQSASCMEGALLALILLSAQGISTWLVDLKVDEKNKKDVDHVVAVFRLHGYFGAISKTSHSVLRYREPIYKTLRELVLSYFHEYFLDDGVKTLRSYSKLFSLPKKYGDAWISSPEDLYEIAYILDKSPHIPILPTHAIKTLRRADSIEIQAGKII